MNHNTSSQAIEHTQTCMNRIDQHPLPQNLSLSQAQHIYPLFVQTVIYHNIRYYQDNTPVISDREYDQLFSYLQSIEERFPTIISDNSPTQSLQDQSTTQESTQESTQEGFEKADHLRPLLSLDNSYNAQDLRNFDDFIDQRIQESYHYLVQAKFDGISVEYIYRNGKFHQAITRGNGIQGEDITINAQHITNLPTHLTQTDQYPVPEVLSVRGEIMMPRSVRKKLNKDKIAQGLSPFANTRNAAAGTIKLLDPHIVQQRKLISYVYDVLHCQGVPRQSVSEDMHALQARGLPVYPFNHTYDEIDQVIAYCEAHSTKERLDQADIDFDGLVIKVQDIRHQEELGSTQHHPRWAIAYKFPAQQIAAYIQQVHFQVGRTGILTPVAMLTPVQLSGVTISRVSLHNMDIIKDKDIHIHDRVRLQRSGEVIPHVLGVIQERRAENVQTIQVPSHCPQCQQTIKEHDGHFYCVNLSCPAILQGRLEHRVSKHAMNIDGMGPSIIELLINQGMLTQCSDIYMLLEPEHALTLTRLPGIGHKTIQHIQQQLQNSKESDLRRILHALGFPGVGKKIAQSLSLYIAKQINQDINQDVNQASIRSVIRTHLENQQTLEKIDGIGPSIIQGIQDFFHTSELQSERDTLTHYGIQPILPENKHGPLSGLSFGITGSFPLSRDEIVAHLEGLGAEYRGTPSTTTTAMLIGERPGSKAQKARKRKLELYEGRESICTRFPSLRALTDSQPPSLFG